ncbi:hypothetical protein AEI05_09465 [Campylobacter jejuni]|uniref:hypothetical protein n=1 Tax=Campylobacter jejuni TaxID=197 RepID=UPI0002586731|nr:hypothetical protein [Campylobacter jejuni]ALW35760.1 hypothetical protein RC39_08640 [Campylobacter jejuni]ALW54755.1 hypothetical protein RC02_08605 [Campylobacter jejuni]ALW80404.1 hypothetical protein RC23_08540 [Campylobacter jejuni]ECO3402387.1 hypothetical protein [Campylobacter jejuni]EIB85432.1 hypothetical protein cje89_07083 [Campylobacter jejuni subsp. jejuni LMG 9872]
MFVGFSKNLGNGFRIGVGYNFNDKPSKRDNDREEFILKVLNEVKSLFQTMCRNINVSVGTFEFAIEQNCQIEITDILTENNSKKISEISDLFSKISELIEKIRFSKSLSTQTREKITDFVFESKKIISTLEYENDLEERLILLLSEKLQKEENEIKKMIKKSQKNKTEKKKMGCLTYIIIFFIVMFLISLITNEDKTNNPKNSSKIEKKIK